jgi:DNA-directed RNA polymerase alpha subunit
MSSDSTKGVIKISKVDVTIPQSADLTDLILMIQETIALKKAGYVLHNDPFQRLCGKTLEFAKKEVIEIRSPSETLECSMSDLDLSPRAMRCLMDAGIETINGLVKKSERELLLINGLGHASVANIKKALMAENLSLCG